MVRAVALFWLASFSVCMVTQLAQAQPAGIPRIGFLSPATPKSMASRIEAFRQGLRDFGYREGKDIAVEYRWAEGNEDRLRMLAEDLLKLDVAMFMVHGVTAAQAARAVSRTVPIICFACGDVVGTKLVANLARPGGNITGISVMQPEVSGKRLELLRDVVPGLSRIAVLFNSGNPVSIPELQETEQAASAFGFRLQRIGVAGPGALEDAFASMGKERAQALIVLSDAMFFGRRTQISQLATAYKLPSISWTGEFAKAGMLMGYGPEVHAIARRSAYFVHSVLKGAKPSELPIEQPTKFEFVINLRTAQTIGAVVPQAIVLRADELVR